MAENNLGKHPIKPLPFAYNATKGISEQVNKWHHDTHYAGYVNKRNEIELELQKVDRSKANANWSVFRALKERETFNANGQVLHEIYWGVLGGDGQPNNELPIIKKITQDFGSFDAWKEDFIASAKVALGWAVLVFDPSDGRLRNFIGDTQNQGAVWGAIPMLAIDVFEHSYYYDYGPDRAKYIQAYLENIDWERVEERFNRPVPKNSE